MAPVTHTVPSARVPFRMNVPDSTGDDSCTWSGAIREADTPEPAVPLETCTLA